MPKINWTLATFLDQGLVLIPFLKKGKHDYSRNKLDDLYPGLSFVVYQLECETTFPLMS